MSYPHFYLILSRDIVLVELADIQTAYYMVAATGVLVAAVFYILNLRISQRNQELSLKALEQSAKAQQQTLETRQAQMFMNIYQQRTSKEYIQASHRIMEESQWSTWVELQENWRDKDFREAFNVVGTYYEGLGVLVREGFLNIRMIALLMCGETLRFWEKVGPVIGDARKDMDYSRFLSESEYLCLELVKYLGDHPELRTGAFKPYSEWAGKLQ
jgi:hypothetical protein